MPSDDEAKVHGRAIFWLLSIIVNGACYNLAWQFKVQAYKCDLVTRVSPIFYLETAFSMLLDIVLFKINFSPLQLTGLILVVGMFLIIITLAYLR